MKRSSSSKPPAAIDRQAEIQQILAILHKWGIHTLGQLAVLDRGELRARLGTEAARMWERANGLSNRLLKFVQPPESFEENFEFENEIAPGYAAGETHGTHGGFRAAGDEADFFDERNRARNQRGKFKFESRGYT